MKYTLIASVMIPAIAAPSGWARVAKTFHISSTTPVWMVRMLDEAIRK
jgi:hypothetical protein